MDIFSLEVRGFKEEIFKVLDSVLAPDSSKISRGATVVKKVNGRLDRCTVEKSYPELKSSKKMELKKYTKKLFKTATVQ